MSQEQAAITRVLAYFAGQFLHKHRHNPDISKTLAFARAQARISAWRRLAD